VLYPLSYEGTKAMLARARPTDRPEGRRDTALAGGPSWKRWDTQKCIGAGCYLPAPILNILVPHVGQTPCVAGLPFFMVTFFSSFISRLVRHLTQ
jgi:hypothetical protein